MREGTSALLKIQFGVRRGSEYTAVFYPSVNRIDGRRMLLAPDATLSQQTQVPTIVLEAVSPDRLKGT